MTPQQSLNVGIFDVCVRSTNKIKIGESSKMFLSQELYLMGTARD